MVAPQSLRFYGARIPFILLLLLFTNLSRIEGNRTGTDVSAASQQMFSVSGRVKNVNRRGLPATVIAFPYSGGQNPTVNTNSNGDFTFTNLKAGETYGVRVDLTDNSVFVTYSRDNPFAVGPLTRNVTGLDFTAQSPTFVAAGRVCRGPGSVCGTGTQRVSGVTVTLTYSGGGSTGVAPIVTDSSGTFSFNLAVHGDYVVSVSNTPFSFPKTSIQYNDVKSNFSNQDFVTPPDTTAPVVTITSPTSNSTYPTNNNTISLSGTAQDASGIAAVTWTNNRGGSGTGIGTTSWQINNIALQSGANVVTVSARDNAGNTGTDVLTVTYTPPTYAISGRIKNLNGRGLEASIQAFPNQGGAAPIVNTNSNGEYRLTGLTAGEIYSVSVTTPDDSVSAWTPDNPTFVGPLTKDITGLDFTAKFPAWSVAGVICRGTGNLCNAGTQRLSGVTVTLTLKGNSTPVAPVITTDALGAYSFSNLMSARGDYVVTVTSNQYSFPRPSLEYPNIKGNYINEDYVSPPDAAPPVVTITAPTSDPSLTTSGAAINLGGTAQDASGIKSVTWKNDRGGNGTATGTANWQVNGIGLLTGVNVLTISAEDNAGNIGTDALTVTYAPPPIVTIAATDPAASEQGPKSGILTITRSVASSASLTVNYSIGGTATAGSDFETIPASVVIPADSTSAVVTIKPIDDALVEGNETVALTLAASADYVVGSPNSATVTILDNDSHPPTVSITSPADGAKFTAPAMIPIEAGAADSDGTVNKVEFFAGANKLGEDASAPYRYDWANVAPGSYVLTARATDDKGVTTTSTPVTVTVGNAIAIASAASFALNWVASESIAAAFGANLTTTSESASSLPLPTTLAGISLKVRDVAGTETLAPLFFASPSQVNLLVPEAAVEGPATITLLAGDKTIATGGASIAATAPALFTASSDGGGYPTASVLRVKTNGDLIYEPVATFDPVQSKFIAAPIDFGDPTDQLFLVIFGTGFRHRSSLAGVNVKIGGLNARVDYVGRQNDFVGLDQLNIALDRALIGRGEAILQLTVDEKAANPVKIFFK